MAGTISSHVRGEPTDPHASNEQARSAAASLCAAARVLARNATGPDRERHLMLLTQVEDAAERLRLALG